MLEPFTHTLTHTQEMWLTAPSRPVVNYSAQSDGPTDRSAYRETEHQSETESETGRQRDIHTDRQKAVDHQNLPSGIFLFIINNSIEFYINLCAFTVQGFSILKETRFEILCSFTCCWPPRGRKVSTLTHKNKKQLVVFCITTHYKRRTNQLTVLVIFWKIQYIVFSRAKPHPAAASQ